MTETATLKEVNLQQAERSVEPISPPPHQHFENHGSPSCPFAEPGPPRGLNTKDVPTDNASVPPQSFPVVSLAPAHSPKRKRKYSESENVQNGQRLVTGGNGKPLRTPAINNSSGSDKQKGPLNDPRQRQQQKKKKKKFEYGNYSQYYGYRNLGINDDPRLRVFRREWFQGKTVLDIGCNAGLVTLFIAKHWRPGRIVGIDIDGGLIYAARQNIKNYLLDTQVQENSDNKGNAEPSQFVGNDRQETFLENEGQQVDCTVKKLAEASGGKEMPGVALNVHSGVHQEGLSTSRMSESPSLSIPFPNKPSKPPGNFPENVCFVRGNYVLENDLLLLTQKEEYDVILCLSVTKWIHLNWGDAGLKRLFRRVYKHLLPGGLFVLEPQPWSSYDRRRKLTDTIRNNYKSIQFQPDQFASYLISEVGFSSCELIGTPKSSSQGFERPIYIFHKDHTPSEKTA